MKRIYLILPCLALSAFAGCHNQQNTRRETTPDAARYDVLDPYAQRDGFKDAQADISRGKLRIVSFGLPAPWSAQYEEILQRDYGIEDHTIAGCVVSASLVKYATAYNQVMDERIKELHGADVFVTAAAKARQLYAAQSSPAKRD